MFLFVPANCTSVLQPCDYSLNRSFKSSLRRRFNQYAFGIVSEQMKNGNVTGIPNCLSLGIVKPLITQWCHDIWKSYNSSVEFHNMVLSGWNHCVLKYGDPFDKHFQTDSAELVMLGELQVYSVVPEENEGVDTDLDSEPDSDGDREDSEDEIDLMKELSIGQRKSGRKRQRPAELGWTVRTDRRQFWKDLTIDEDDEKQ